MNSMNRFGPVQQSLVSNPEMERAFITKVYGWMAMALTITGLVAVATAANADVMLPLLSGPGLIVMFVLQIGTVLVLSFALNKLSAGMATGLFIFYAALTGFTISTIFLVFTASSIASTFFVTAGTFAVVSAYGYVTKTDLTKLGNLMLMGLIGILIASLVNIFLQSTALMWIVTYIGVVVFVGLIAYDTQRIKRMANGLGEQGGDVERKAAVIGALALYLDFINLFLQFQRILGQRR